MWPACCLWVRAEHVGKQTLCLSSNYVKWNMRFPLRSSHCLSPPREAGWFKPCWCCWGHPCDPLSPLLIYSGVAGTLSTMTPSLARAWSSQKSHLFGGAQNMGSYDGTMPLFPVWWNKSEGKRVQKKRKTEKQQREEFKSSKVGLSQNGCLTRFPPPPPPECCIHFHINY